MVQRRYILTSTALIFSALLLLGFPALGVAVPSQPSPSAGVVRFEGKIEAITASQWTIRGKTLFLSPETEVLEEAGRAEVGAWASVQATWRSRGELWADWIRVLRPAGSVEQVTEFTGLIEKVGEDSWIVGGIELCITPDTIIEGRPKPGVPAGVRARLVDDCWQALEIRVYRALDEGQDVEFEGVIQAIGPALWVVSGVAVEVDDTTIIVGEPQIGRLAEVAAVLQTDGRLRGQHLRVLPAEDPEVVEFSGLVLEMRSIEQHQEWDILRLEPSAAASTATILVDQRTFVDQSRALAAPGMWVDVESQSDDLARLWAQRIRVERPIPVVVVGASPSDLPAAPSWWPVDGRWVYVHSETALPISLIAGTPVQVEGLTLGNGAIWADQITPLEANPD